LRKIGITVSTEPTIFELVGGFADAVDDHVRRTGGRTDLGEMAQMGAAESLTSHLRQRTTSLFETTPELVQQELAALGTRNQFSGLARDFFSRLAERYLMYFLSRQTSTQFNSVPANRDFREALALHCRQASRIVEDFAGGWYSKANYQGGITPRKVANFVQVALTKLRTELGRERRMSVVERVILCGGVPSPRRLKKDTLLALRLD
jgi:hypothetical protein